MKPKVEKKGKKRSLSEASLSTKPSQKDENVIDLKKSPKRPKLSLQNGKPTMENKVQILKKMYKQKEKQKEKTKQINIGPVQKIKKKTEGKIKLPIAKLNEESAIITGKSREKVLKNLKKKLEKPNLLKKKRKRSLDHGSNITLSIEEMEAKIEEIRSREVISKRAKKILSVLNRKLKHEKSVTNSEKLNIKKEKNTKNEQQTGKLVKTKQVSNENNKGKLKVKKEHDQSKKVLIKQQEIDDDSDDEVMKSVDDENESDEDQSNTEIEESVDNASEQLDESDDDDEDDDDEDDDDDDKEDEKAEEDEEDEEDDDGEDKDDEDDEDKDDEDGEDKDDEDEKVNILKVKQEDLKKTKKQATQPLEHQKKNQYVLFVGNLPFNVTFNELKQHFLTKVSAVSDIRIPTSPDTKKPRGFAYVELTNSADFQKGLLLNHTFLNKRRINVEPTRSNDNKKNVGKNFAFAKNKKPQAFQKAKQLVSGNQGKKKSIKKEK